MQSVPDDLRLLLHGLWQAHQALAESQLQLLHKRLWLSYYHPSATSLSLGTPVVVGLVD